MSATAMRSTARVVERWRIDGLGPDRAGAFSGAKDRLRRPALSGVRVVMEVHDGARDVTATCEIFEDRYAEPRARVVGALPSLALERSRLVADPSASQTWPTAANASRRPVAGRRRDGSPSGFAVPPTLAAGASGAAMRICFARLG